jgi:nitrate/nitrite transporter NarK
MNSKAAKWIVLGMVSFTLVTGYIITDLMAPLDIMLEQQLGWNSSEYGIFNFGYGLFNVFLLMLIFGGMLLDRFGARLTGIIAIVLMFVGAAVKYWAITTGFGGEVMTVLGFTMKVQAFWAMIGFAIFGVGIEMIGITATKIIVKWFNGRSLALAMGLNVAAGRIGTGIALFGAYPYARLMGSVSAPLALCMVLLAIGLLSYLVFVVLDARSDREAPRTGEVADDEKFRFSDIFSIARMSGFWFLALMCVCFYSAVFPFLKFATSFMIQKYGFTPFWAGFIPALIPFGNILLTPVFGSIYDRKGRGASIMILGAFMLIGVHVLFAIPALTWSVVAIILMIVLGAAFSLVPSAMWPSVPKIIPFNKLGTAYAMIFWIQNWGLMGVPLLMGWVRGRFATGEIIVDGHPTTAYDYTWVMVIFASLGVLALAMGLLLKRADARKGYGLQKPNMRS